MHARYNRWSDCIQFHIAQVDCFILMRAFFRFDFRFGQPFSKVVLHDTPGVVAPSSLRGTRHENRVRSAWNAAGDADLLVYLVDAQRQVPAVHNK